MHNPTAMSNCLARLNLLAMDSSDPTLKKRGDYPEVQSPVKAFVPVNEREQVPNSTGTDEEQLKRSIDLLTRRPKGYLPSTQSIAYGYRSLAVSNMDKNLLHN